MKAKVDKEGCIGCGLCVSIAPEIFELDQDEKSQVYGKITADLEEKAQQASNSCPVAVIEIES